MQDAYGLSADDAVLQKTPFGFDVSVWEFFWPLLVGRGWWWRSPARIAIRRSCCETIEAQGVTTLHFVPSMLQAFVEHLSSQPQAVRRCGSIRRLICSGEALPAELAGPGGAAAAAGAA